jgi:hypothetical protein
VIEAPKQFWLLAGIALIVVAAALAFRIVNPNQAVQVQTGDGLSISLGVVQKNIDAAQQNITQFQQQAIAQQNEIAQLQARIAADQNEIRSLISSPAAPAAFRSAATGLLNAQAARPLPTVRAIDPALLAGAQMQLKTASRLADALIVQKK